MSKRPHLRPTRPLVNAGFAAAMIFLGACSDKAPETSEIIQDPAPLETIPIAPAAPIGPVLPAVWSTSGLPAPIVGIAISGGPSPIVAVVLNDGRLQLFDMQGDRITEPVDLGIAAIATGRDVTINGATLTVFPGISTTGAINLYAYNSALAAPVAFDLLPDAGAYMLCGGPSADDDGLFHLNHTGQNEGAIGTVDISDNAFVWTPAGQRFHHVTLTQECIVTDGPPRRDGQNVLRSVLVTIGDAHRRLDLTVSGELILKTEDTPVTLRDGITIRAPNPITAMAALSDVRFGGYPNGVIIVGGPVGDEHQIVFIEPGPLFGPAPEATRPNIELPEGLLRPDLDGPGPAPEAQP